MSSDKLTGYLLTPKAIEDLENIWRYSAETWSVDQADIYIDGLVQLFDGLVQTPLMARERPEFFPPVRIQIHQSHLVIYKVEADHILIVRVLGGKQNWFDVLHSTEL
ncbi:MULTISPECIES: type II toxin-antitoxin system RelE/ParE family toxin [Thalassospira]|uniref:Toxin n=2 Tax=Thalassospira TaxID=168934 RepID=A0A367W604_9PROT|nr:MULTISPECIES: type II toxin-antitoxin system RelE/ParE family toxin [Thalassospira]MDG4719347.1 type II toxin-antitoxin system RelE/ParE family toxin [Thalassospira sp. FZY0004]RCK36817.1 hypothetical protein TH19_12975 [Thalassospira profundimaris]